MTFLNIALLGGVAAFSIPLIIHLFNRSRFKVVQWGAMHLLEPVLRKNYRKLRLEQLLLLLIRAAIPVFLALAMAKPVITGWRSLAGDAKSSMVVLLDSSYSMQASPGARSNFEVAQEETEKLLTGLQRQSDVAVLQMGGEARPLTQPVRSTDHRGTRARLKEATAGLGAVDMRRSLDEGIRTMTDMANAKREMVLVSDFQKINWQDVPGSDRELLREKLSQLEPRPVLTFVHVGSEVKDNIAVQQVTRRPRVVGPQQQVKLTAHLHNYGTEEHANVRVQLFVDNIPADVVTLNKPLGPGQDDQVSFHCSFQKPGSHWVKVVVEGDSVKADDSYLMSVPVLEKIPVLIVTGDPSPEFGKGETDLLAVALQPFGALKQGDLRDLVSPRVIEPGEFDEGADLSDVRVIILANVPSLEEEQVEKLESFVREGGGLIVFPGDRIAGPARAWYDSYLYKGGEGLLPGRIVGMGGSTTGEKQYVSVARQSYDHPAVELFRDPRNGNFSAVEMHRWFKLADDGLASGGRKPATVMVHLENRDPLLMEKPYGEGRVIVSAGPCDSQWSNLAGLGNIYVPLMQRMVTYLASQVEPERTVEVGQPLVTFFDREDVGKRLPVRFYPIDGPGSENAGSSEEMPPVMVVRRGPRGMVQIDDADRPGLYVVMSPEDEPVHLVVNAPRRESDLRQMTRTEVEGLAKEMGADLVNSADEYIALDRERRFGKEIWTYLLWVALALVFAELLLQQFVVRKKR